MLAPRAHSRPWATVEAWERHRDEISTLYQSKTLKEVMEHMERAHDFHATLVSTYPRAAAPRNKVKILLTANIHYRDRMYKFRIKSWGLRKNWGDAVAKRALQRIGNSTSVQGDTPIFLATETAQLRKLERYLKRKPETLQQLQETHKAALQTLHTKTAVSKRVALTGQRQLRPSTLRAPIQLELPDEIFRLLSAFLASAPRDAVMGQSRPPEQDEPSTS